VRSFLSRFEHKNVCNFFPRLNKAIFFKWLKQFCTGSTEIDDFFYKKILST